MNFILSKIFLKTHVTVVKLEYIVNIYDLNYIYSFEYLEVFSIFMLKFSTYSKTFICETKYFLNNQNEHLDFEKYLEKIDNQEPQNRVL